MSLAVVMNGPVARAGSMFRLSNMRGTKAPNKAAKTMTHNSEALTVVLKFQPNKDQMLI